ncbi:MAG: hypothetical protein U9R19_05070, partial [Bacteroidota bacterium]|nr:hypothetical protein [Bacteroidota bacterium]
KIWEKVIGGGSWKSEYGKSKQRIDSIDSWFFSAYIRYSQSTIGYSSVNFKISKTFEVEQIICPTLQA